MFWKTKAFIQNFIASMPSGLSYELYFRVQRYFGRFRKPYSPIGYFSGAVSFLNRYMYMNRA